MKQQISRIVASYWQARAPALSNTLAHAARQVKSLLDWEEDSRSAYGDTDRLGKALGGFGSDTLDLGALSAVLQQSHGSRVMEQARYQRLTKLQQDLAEAIESLQQTPPLVAEHDLSQDTATLLQAYDAHMARLSEMLRLVRLAKLEARGSYDAAEHEAAFAHFDWRRLDSAEMSLCPPFLVYARPGRHFGEQLGSLLELATSGRPLDLVVLHEAWQPDGEETGRAAALRGMNDVTLFFLAVRSAYFVQSSVVSPTPLADQLVRALESPRAAVISIYADGNGDEDFARHAEGALRSRAFPHFVYDPEQAPDFVSCLDLSDNPEPESQWIRQALVYLDDEDEHQELQRPLTFADYAAGEPEFVGQFTPADAESDAKLTPLADYLELDVSEHWQRRPFVYGLDEERHLLRLIPSDAMLAHTMDRMHLWTTLQELGGIHNPFVRAAEKRLRSQLEEDKTQALAAQADQLRTQFDAALQGQLESAMRKLASRLTGMNLDNIEPSAIPAETGAGSASAPPVPAAPTPPADLPPPAVTSASADDTTEPDSEPWIDQRLCTSCDECIEISKKLFAYDDSKKAIIVDSRAGPYKDIVRAAEKCSSGAIHPGMPLDPGEKGLDKWIKRAEAYQ